MSSIIISSGFSRLISVDPARATVRQEGDAKKVPQVDEIRRDAVAEAEQRLESEIAVQKEHQAKLWAALERSFTEFLDNVEVQIRDQLIDLSTKVAEIIVRRELPDREMIKQVIDETLGPITDLQGAKVRLSPSDAESIIEARRTTGAQGAVDRIEIMADASLVTGDVLVESRNGYFDARIGERLKLLGERLSERHRNANADEGQS